MDWSNPIWGLTVIYVAIIVGVVLVLWRVIGSVKPEYGGTLREIFRTIHFLELTTVLAIVVSATYLGLADKLNNGLIALLTGVAGYVLGSLKDGSPRSVEKLPEK